MTGNNKGKAKIVEKSSRSPTYCSDSKQDVKKDLGLEIKMAE
jgi:hypothetical protein